MDPFNPHGGQFETFDPYAYEAAVTEAALYGRGCGPEWPPRDPLEPISP